MDKVYMPIVCNDRCWEIPQVQFLTKVDMPVVFNDGSRASVTCLLCVGQGVDEFFAVVKGVGDVLDGRGAGC